MQFHSSGQGGHGIERKTDKFHGLSLGFVLDSGAIAGNWSGRARIRVSQPAPARMQSTSPGHARVCQTGCSIKTWYQFNFLIFAMRKDSNRIFLMLLKDIFGLVLES